MQEINPEILKNFNVIRTDGKETIRPKPLPVLLRSAFLLILGIGLVYFGLSHSLNMVIFGAFSIIVAVFFCRVVLLGVTIDFKARTLNTKSFLLTKKFGFDDITDIAIDQASDSGKSYFVQVVLKNDKSYALLGDLTGDMAEMLEYHIQKAIWQ